MAETLMQKARVAVLANMHHLLDKAVDTPEGFKQHIRDLESGIADLHAALDEQVGDVNGSQRRIAALTNQKDEKQADIDLLLNDDDPSNDESALKLQMSLEDIDGEIANEQELLTAAQANVAALREASDKLDEKHAEMLHDYKKMAVTQATTKAKNKAAEAAEAAAAVSSAVGDVSVDSIQEHLAHNADTADARFDRVMGQFASGDDPEQVAKLARAKQKLVERRAQITGQAAEQVKADASAAANATPATS